MDKIKKLTILIVSLQEKLRTNTLDVGAVKTATEILAGIGYQYDTNLFPELKADAKFSATVESSPNNLAEALLWKMGKWHVYKDFVNNYSSNGHLSKKTDVVFAAFAKHLKNDANPIYDQHALRAMLAINTNFEPYEKEQCKAALFKSKGKEKGKWKAVLSGRETIACYNLYVAKLNELSNTGLSTSALDKLFMPLGQALKENFHNSKEFALLCGGDENDQQSV